jgi:hypothetical protein
MLATAAATKVLPSDQDGGAFDVHSIEFKVGVFGDTIIEKPPIEKQELTEASSFDAFEKLFRDDRIRVDIGPVQRRDNALMNCEVLHGSVFALAVSEQR